MKKPSKQQNYEQPNEQKNKRNLDRPKKWLGVYKHLRYEKKPKHMK